MAKLLYTLKIFLFRNNLQALKLTTREEKQIIRFVSFGVLIYTKIWVEAALAADAPVNDLLLWKSLKFYEAIDSKIGVAARGHLWYLPDELVALALFSEKPSDCEKQTKVQKTNSDGGNRSV
ncbi:hypothetical protein EVAR_30034_1 [Eumeta japonica]|uniref:Uncharacterized protein n=1 Tax=Eumeta variegata TaxID=151549 RepID=A0A4C1VUI8_EUMVA|nr:hypothetical protein EVAR_30034_1 [Eumeta japonica]